MTIIQVIIALLFLISIGSMNLHRAKNWDAMMESNLNGKLVLTILPLISLIFLTLTISKLGGLKWYWSFLISIISVFLLSGLLSTVYSSILGYKSKPVLSFMGGGYVKHNFYIIDSLITLGLGIVLYFIF